MGNRQGQRTDLDNVLPKSDKGKFADIAAAVRNRQAQLKVPAHRLSADATGGSGATLPGLATGTRHGRVRMANFEGDSGQESDGGEGVKDYG